MAELRLLARSLCIFYIISALRHSLTNTLRGKEIMPSGTAKTGASFLKAFSHDSGLRAKRLGGRKMMMERMDELELSKTSGFEHDGSNNSLETSSKQVNYQHLEASYMNPAKPIKTSLKSSSMADENESTRQGTHTGAAQKVKKQSLADPPEQIENFMVKDYGSDMGRHPPPINNHEPLD